MGLFSSEIALHRLVPMCRKLATAQEAGLPITRTLNMLVEQEHNRRLRKILQQIEQDVLQGATLEAAFRVHADYLPSSVIELIASGEAGGHIEKALNDLAQYMEQRQEMARQFIMMMIGPIVRLLAAWFLGTFALRIIPEIKRLVMAGGQEEFSLSGYFHDYLVFQGRAILLAFTAFVFFVLIARTGIFRWIRTAFSTYIWPFSLVARRFALARFFHTLSLLLQSGLSIAECIRKAAATTGNPHVQRDLLRVVPHIEDGQSIMESFAASRFLTRLAREMLDVGEETGKLVEATHKVAEYHFAEASTAVKVTTQVVNVVIVLSVAILIAYIVIAFFLYLYYGIVEAFK